jgi:hypothetical protein
MRPVQLLFRRAGSLALWCTFGWILAIIAGCGPGTGGTGTGQTTTPLDYFGATPANICTSGPASALACPTPGNTGAVGAGDPIAVANGTDGVFFSTTEGADINLLLSGNRATLTDRCLSLTFSGDWATVGSNDARFFGEYTTAGTSVAALSSLTAQAVGTDNKRLSVLLRDANGRVVLGPVTLRRVLVPTSNPAACNR